MEDPPNSMINFNIQFSGKKIPISILSDSTVKDLKTLLLPLTNILPRGQKLICKGKVLTDSMTLRELQITNGSKVMLIAAQGLHQGDGPIVKDSKRKLLSDNSAPTPTTNRISRWKITGVVALSECALKVVPEEVWSIGGSVRLLDLSNNFIQEVSAKFGSLCTLNDGPIVKDSKRKLLSDNSAPTPTTNRISRWKITGVVALSECALKVVPEEVWSIGESVRLLDLSNNFIQEVSAKFGSLCTLNKLLLNTNDISDGRISWEGLSNLKCLTVLSINHNHLTTLPSALGTLTSLKELHVSNNKLTSLPDQLELLNELQVLTVKSNRISTVPSSIGNCCSLIEIDLSSNLLVDLPETFGNLRNLKALHLSNNGLTSLPATLFKMCTQLSTLNLHGTQITNDVLREFEGWEVFDERRRLKHQKQLDFRVGSSGKFDEGADDDSRP